MSALARRWPWQLRDLVRDVGTGRYALGGVELQVAEGEVPIVVSSYVRVEKPKRRRFNGATRRQARAAWITLIADALAAPIAAYMAGEVGAPGLAAALPDKARRFADLAIEASKIKPPSRMRAFIVDAARRAVTGPAPFRLDPALSNADAARMRRILGFGTEGR